MFINMLENNINKILKDENYKITKDRVRMYIECDSSSELYYLDGSASYFVADESGGWYEEDYRTIHITTEPTDETVKQWIWENATKLEESYPDES